MALPVSAVIEIEDPSRYKLHVARWNGHDQPLDLYVRGEDEWFAWNQRTGKEELNRELVFSIIDFYHETDTWLFGGIFQVTGREPTSNNWGNTIEELLEYSAFVGRLKIRMPRPPRGRAFPLEKHIHLGLAEKPPT